MLYKFPKKLEQPESTAPIPTRKSSEKENHLSTPKFSEMVFSPSSNSQIAVCQSKNTDGPKSPIIRRKVGETPPFPLYNESIYLKINLFHPPLQPFPRLPRYFGPPSQQLVALPNVPRRLRQSRHVPRGRDDQSPLPRAPHAMRDGAYDHL